MTRGVQVVMSTRINSVLDALMSTLIAVDIDTTWRFLTEYWVVVMDTTAIQEKLHGTLQTLAFFQHSLPSRGLRAVRVCCVLSVCACAVAAMITVCCKRVASKR